MITAFQMGMPLSVARGVRLPGDRVQQRDWALAQAARQLDMMRCPRCGKYLWEALDPKVQWRAKDPQRCGPCTVISAKQDSYQDADHSSALVFDAERVT